MRFFVQQARSISVVGMIASVLFTTGCGGRPATVSGVVSIDGSPLQTGTVTFSPASGGMRASGLIQDDGSYEIRTNRDMGLEIGEYQVAVSSREVIDTGPESPPRPGKYFAPKRYGRTSTSGLQYSVDKGSNEIDIKLSSDGLEQDNRPRRRR